jgi:ribosomal protein L21
MNRRDPRNKKKIQRRKVRAMKGRILKIKTGYNPNSSSIGVDVVVFFTAGAAMTVLFNTLAAVLAAAKVHEHGRPEALEETPVLSHGKEKG